MRDYSPKYNLLRGMNLSLEIQEITRTFQTFLSTAAMTPSPLLCRRPSFADLSPGTSFFKSKRNEYLYILAKCQHNRGDGLSKTLVTISLLNFLKKVITGFSFCLLWSISNLIFITGATRYLWSTSVTERFIQVIYWQNQKQEKPDHSTPRHNIYSFQCVFNKGGKEEGWGGGRG